jgi:hypothetical protein
MRTRALWILFSLVLVSCRPPQTRVPAAYVGTDLVTIENFLNADICELRLTKKGDSPTKNWREQGDSATGVCTLQ